MSPTDEIRYINKLAATKGTRGLNPYQRWVYGGCKGPSPTRRGAKKRGPCRDTKPLGVAEVVRLREHVTGLLTTIDDLRSDLHNMRNALRDLEEDGKKIVKLLGGDL